MSFTPFVETGQPTMAAFNEKFQTAIDEAVQKGIKVIHGQYKGTGAYGSGNQSHISVSGKPLALFIRGINIGYTVYGAAILGEGKVLTDSAGPAEEYLTVTSFSETISWYSEFYAYGQLNESGKTYYYTVILEGDDA